MRRVLFHIPPLSIFYVIIFFAFLSSQAGAFYEHQGDRASLDLTGMLQIYGIAYKNPEDTAFYEEKGNSGLAGLGRVIMNAQAGETLSLEVNAYQTYIPKALAGDQTGAGVTIPDVERSSALEWSLREDKYIHTAMDRLNLRWSKDRLDVILGRQPVNLATTFYFSPNDFFAPFAAQTFYRVYKPGVDAIRAEVRLGDLSQLSLISVLGYNQDHKSDTGWSSSPDASRGSYLGRISKNFYYFEWALIAGSLADSDIIGGSLQGEAFKWLGIRAEGHIARPESSEKDTHTEFALGIEHYWENNLDMRLEYFYHGSGLPSYSVYMTALSDSKGHGLYLGRNYAALGIGYEFSPMLNGQTALIGNLTDDSLLSSFNAVYSLSNESELSFGLAVPWGKKPKGDEIKSEFGLYPYTFNIEWRWYF